MPRDSIKCNESESVRGYVHQSAMHSRYCLDWPNVDMRAHWIAFESFQSLIDGFGAMHSIASLHKFSSVARTGAPFCMDKYVSDPFGSASMSDYDQPFIPRDDGNAPSCQLARASGVKATSTGARDKVTSTWRNRVFRPFAFTAAKRYVCLME